MPFIINGSSRRCSATIESFCCSGRSGNVRSHHIFVCTSVTSGKIWFRYAAEPKNVLRCARVGAAAPVTSALPPQPRNCCMPTLLLQFSSIPPIVDSSSETEVSVSTPCSDDRSSKFKPIGHSSSVGSITTTLPSRSRGIISSRSSTVSPLKSSMPNPPSTRNTSPIITLARCDLPAPVVAVIWV